MFVACPLSISRKYEIGGHQVVTRRYVVKRAKFKKNAVRFVDDTDNVKRRQKLR